MNKNKVMTFLKNGMKEQKVKRAADAKLLINATENSIYICGVCRVILTSIRVPNTTGKVGIYDADDIDEFLNDFKTDGLNCLKKYMERISSQEEMAEKHYDKIIIDHHKNFGGTPYTGILKLIEHSFEPQKLEVIIDAERKFHNKKWIDLCKVGDYYYNQMLYERMTTFKSDLMQDSNGVLFAYGKQKDFETFSILAPFHVKN